MQYKRVPERSNVGSKEGLQTETCSASLKQRFQRQSTPSETLQDLNRGRETDLGRPSKQKIFHKLTNMSSYQVGYYIEEKMPNPGHLLQPQALLYQPSAFPHRKFLNGNVVKS